MAEYDHPSSFPQGDTSTDGNRSITRGSHNSDSSDIASTRSWVVSNQMNPPLPPVLQSVPPPSPETQQVRRYPTPAIEDEDNSASPTSMENAPEKPKSGGRSLTGRLMNGLTRLATALRIGGGGQKSKKRIARQGALGTPDVWSSTTGITTGNTLPPYLSNPSIGPSNPQFAHHLSMAVPNSGFPPDYNPFVSTDAHWLSPISFPRPYPTDLGNIIHIPPSPSSSPGSSIDTYRRRDSRQSRRRRSRSSSFRSWEVRDLSN